MQVAEKFFFKGMGGGVNFWCKNGGEKREGMGRKIISRERSFYHVCLGPAFYVAFCRQTTWECAH